MKLRIWGLTLGLAGVFCLPAVAQYQERQDQPRHDQDDQNRDRARGYDNDQDRNNPGYYNQGNEQWRNTKAYQEGWKDGEHDRSKNKTEHPGKRHWKNQQDEQAYQAGYYDAFRGNGAEPNRRDHDKDRRDHDKDRRDHDNDRDQH